MKIRGFLTVPHVFVEKKPRGRKGCGTGFKLRHVQNVADGPSPFPDRLVHYSSYMTEETRQGCGLVQKKYLI